MLSLESKAQTNFISLFIMVVFFLSNATNLRCGLVTVWKWLHVVVVVVCFFVDVYVHHLFYPSRHEENQNSPIARFKAR